MSEQSPSELNPEMRSCQINLMIHVYNINNLREGLDMSALNIGRYGLGGGFIVAVDPTSGERWEVQDGDRIYPFSEAKEEVEKIPLEDDPVMAEAIQRIVTAIQEDERRDRRA